MTRDRTVFLMYHELQLPGRATCQSEPGYLRYVISEDDFRAQLAALRAAGFLGLSVGEALNGSQSEQPAVAITFDDGCETDLLTAAPLLRTAGFNATFYVVAGFVGRPGYLAPGQVRELAAMGFEVGCHSMTHPYLSDLDPAALRVEVIEAKQRLEQMTGKGVEHFSCPGGRWTPEVARLAREAGYASVATSRVGANGPTADRFRLSRVAIRRGTALADFERLCRGRRLWRQRVRDSVLGAAKGLLGNSVYEKLRAAMFGSGG